MLPTMAQRSLLSLFVCCNLSPVPPSSLYASSPSKNLTNPERRQYTEYNAYTSHIATLPAFSTASSVLATHTQSIDFAQTSLFQAAATATTPVTVPSIATGLPTDVQAFFQSIYQHEVGLLQYDKTATATATYNAATKPTGVMMAAGAAAAGALGMAML